MTSNPSPVSTKVVTVPNLISALRIGLVPVFLWLFLSATNDVLALVILAVVGSTDWVDGFIARKTGQVTVLGKLLDPVADRLAIVSALLALSFRGIVPWLLAGVILLRDLIVSIAFPIIEARGFPRVPVNLVGKAATLLIFFGMAFAAGSLVVGAGYEQSILILSRVLLIVGATAYWIAGALYVKEIRKLRSLST